MNLSNATLATVGNVLDDFARVMASEAGARMTIDVRNLPRDAFYVVMHATQEPMMAVEQFNLSKLALAHAENTEAFIRAMLDEHLKPFTTQVRRAADASRIAWEEAFRADRPD